jgi:hypothetical protein
MSLVMAWAGASGSMVKTGAKAALSQRSIMENMANLVVRRESARARYMLRRNISRCCAAGAPKVGFESQRRFPRVTKAEPHVPPGHGHQKKVKIELFKHLSDMTCGEINLALSAFSNVT